MAMTISNNFIKFLEKFEGKHPEAYKDSNGVWTAGFGHQSKGPYPVKPGVVYSDEQIMEWFRYDAKEHSDIVNRLFRGVALSQNMFDALVSLNYNSGVIQNPIRDLVRENPNDFSRICSAWQTYHICLGSPYEKGLRRRRKAEAALYMTPDGQQPQIAGLPAAANIPGGTSAASNPLSSGMLHANGMTNDANTPPRVYQEFGSTIVLDELSMPVSNVMTRSTQETESPTLETEKEATA